MCQTKLCSVNFPANSISPVSRKNTLLSDAFGSNPNPHFENLKYAIYFQILMIL